MNDERRPKAPLETTAKRSSHTLPPGWPWHEAVDPLRLNGRERRIYYSGYQSGYGDGELIGRRRGWREHVEQEQRAWERMRDSIRVPFANVRYSELCELRGEREAAELARVRERLLGLGEAS